MSTSIRTMTMKLNLIHRSWCSSRINLAMLVSIQVVVSVASVGRIDEVCSSLFSSDMDVV